ncbi:Oxidoreductase chyM [Pseudocercospora fuligena]|uniref:Oxidoreductase chyM n=1 Tax=Pseudocercospora fuligena TaxID=685502 RepID=A0A8H6RCR4_9PEZI|nr:Oxidoreductase chyM [Pseudocercospora fuligena]
MGSIGEEATIYGEFMHPVITAETKNNDPWQRNYNAPPPLKPLVPRRYPLHDIRPKLASTSPEELLQSHGFGVVKHHSSFLDQLNGEELSSHAIAETYHPEVVDLVKKTTGCKEVFIVGSVFRQGKRAPEAYKLPTERRAISQAVDQPQSQQQHKLAGQSKLQLAAPVRVPHMDSTPLGARQTIRFEQKAMYDVAKRAGIIDAEDAIYQNPVTKESDDAIAERYDGPRYAAYSIWRPLRKVGRDPLAVAPRKKGQATTTGGDFVHHFYENKIRGDEELKGDFLKEYTMLGVSNAEARSEDVDDDAIKWYHVSEQEPDEVLFIKLFDSYALGISAQHAPAPWHGSPEIGDAATSDEPRESIDIRIVAFW